MKITHLFAKDSHSKDGPTTACGILIRSGDGLKLASYIKLVDCPACLAALVRHTKGVNSFRQAIYNRIRGE